MNLKQLIVITTAALTIGASAQARDLSANNLYFTRDALALNRLTLRNIDPTFSRCEFSTEILRQMSVAGGVEFTVGKCTKLLVGLQAKDRAELTVSVPDVILNDTTHAEMLSGFDFGSTIDHDVSDLKGACSKAAMDLQRVSLAGDDAAEFQLKIAPVKAVSSTGIPGCEFIDGHVVLKLKALVRTAL